jgi:hypothetical protein
MAIMTFKSFLAFGFSIAVPFDGEQMLPHTCGRAAAIDPLTAGEQGLLAPLHLRWLGNGMDAAKRLWSCLKGASRRAGENCCTLDVMFSFVYGGALAASLWWVWMTLGRPFHPIWIVAPLAMILTADWTEHLIQLAQLRHYVSSNESRIQDLWIEIYGCATIIKLWLTSGLYMSLVGVVIRLVVTRSDRRLAADAAD